MYHDFLKNIFDQGEGKGIRGGDEKVGVREGRGEE